MIGVYLVRVLLHGQGGRSDRILEGMAASLSGDRQLAGVCPEGGTATSDYLTMHLAGLSGFGKSLASGTFKPVSGIRHVSAEALTAQYIDRHNGVQVSQEN